MRSESVLLCCPAISVDLLVTLLLPGDKIN